MSEWYSAVENTVSRSADAASTVIPFSCLRHAFLVRSRRWGNRAGPIPQSRRRFSRACSTPRSEKPMRTSML